MYLYQGKKGYAAYRVYLNIGDKENRDMKAPFNIRTILFIAITGCVVAISVYVYALNVPHHGLDVNASDDDACMSCHDGSIGNAVVFCTVGCDFSTAHVIDKHYPPAGKRNQFRSIASVRARGVELVNDHVVCISCHDIRNQQQYHLVIDNRGSALCLVCHIK